MHDAGVRLDGGCVLYDIRLKLVVARDAVVDEIDFRLVELHVQPADLVDERRETVESNGDIFLNIEAEVAVERVDQLARAAAAVTAAVCAVELIIKREATAAAMRLTRASRMNETSVSVPFSLSSEASIMESERPSEFSVSSALRESVPMSRMLMTSSWSASSRRWASASARGSARWKSR
jgi:hypothetical protein